MRNPFVLLYLLVDLVCNGLHHFQFCLLFLLLFLLLHFNVRILLLHFLLFVLQLGVHRLVSEWILKIPPEIYILWLFVRLSWIVVTWLVTTISDWILSAVLAIFAISIKLIWLAWVLDVYFGYKKFPFLHHTLILGLFLTTIMALVD